MRRIIAISPDLAFGQELAGALYAAGDAVESYPSLEAMGSDASSAALAVIHLPAARLESTRLLPDCPVIVVLPRSNLAALVDLMQTSRRVAGAVVAEDFDPRQLTALATRIVSDDIFGLDKVMAPMTELHSIVVGDYQDKLACMAAIAAFAEQAGAPRKVRDPLEQCIDEMLMNALYDAPVDGDGNHIFAGVPTKDRVMMRSEQSVVVQYGFDGKQLAISVRDVFGSLDRATVLRHLHRGVTQQVERKVGGAGLGLYLMASSATSVYFHVLPGIATEAICIWDLQRPRLELEQFAFVSQVDLAGHVRTGPARALPAVPSRLWQRVGLAIAAVAVLAIGLFTYQRLTRPPPRAQVTFVTVPPGATIEVEGRIFDGVADLAAGRSYQVVARLDGYEPKPSVIEPKAGPSTVTLTLVALARVELDTKPTDATVEIDGKPMGSTPLTLTTLAPGTAVTIVFKRPGYRDATARLVVPPTGQVKQLVQPLVASEDMVRVHFVSTPAGAEITKTGAPPSTDHTYTPADVFVEAGQVQAFTLTMPKHQPLVIPPFTPHRGEQLEKGGTLVEASP